MQRLLLATILVPLLAQAAEPVVFVTGLGEVRGLACDQQGRPFLAAGGGIQRVLGRNLPARFAAVTGSFTGLAFHATGDLYAADTVRKALVRITPWGETHIVAERFEGRPFDSVGQVAAATDGSVYFCDPSASRVYCLDPQGRLALFTAGIRKPRGIAVSADARSVYAADGLGSIWRIASGAPKKFTSVSATALALDENGNLYAAGRGGVAVFDPEGKQIEKHTLPEAEASGLGWGGVDLKTLYVSAGGALYKVRAPHRAARLPWEPDRPLAIDFPPDGAILNRHDGEKAGDGLRIVVEGSSRSAGPVRVNGSTAEIRDGRFRASVVLRERQTKIAAEGPGGLRDSVTVLWDRDSFPRYRFSIDDNIWFLRDIARNAAKYHSIFDNPYLAFWRAMHQKYGTRFHFNIYYETEGFNLSQMPDKFRPEWQKNAGWIRLTFHARANDPDRPYLEASAEHIRRDYRAVNREIERFAGKELMSRFTTVHWGETTLAAARALREEGVAGLAGYFEAPDDLFRVSYYLPVPQCRYLLGRDYWKDMREDILFVRHDMVVNTVPLDQIVPRLEQIARDPHQSEIMELMIHEQYFYPDYRSYEPDYRQRVERAIEWVTKRGYKPVFFMDGFLGAPAGPPR